MFYFNKPLTIVNFIVLADTVVSVLPTSLVLYYFNSPPTLLNMY